MQIVELGGIVYYGLAYKVIVLMKYTIREAALQDLIDDLINMLIGISNRVLTKDRFNHQILMRE